MEYDDDQESQVPAMSAGRVRKHGSGKKSKRGGKRLLGGRGKKPKFRDMILNAIKSYGESKGSNFGKICRFIEKKYKMRNDFVVKHTLKWLLNKKVLMNNGGRYKIISPLAPSAGRKRRRTGRRRGKSRRRRKGGKRRRKGKRRGKRRGRRGSGSSRRRRPRRRKARRGGKRRRPRRGRRGRGRRRSR